MKITVEKAEKPAQVLDREDAKKTADLLATMPHGVLAMSPDIEGLVQTSTNLATIAKKDGAIEIGSSQRSAIESSKQAAAKMVRTASELAGFEADIRRWVSGMEA